MKRFFILGSSEVFHGSDAVLSFSFKTVGTRGGYALLAKANRQVSQSFASLRAESALFDDCFECPPPVMNTD